METGSSGYKRSNGEPVEQGKVALQKSERVFWSVEKWWWSCVFLGGGGGECQLVGWGLVGGASRWINVVGLGAVEATVWELERTTFDDRPTTHSLWPNRVMQW